MSSRVLRDDLWTSERVNALHDKTFRLYVCLINSADDYGLVEISWAEVRRAAPLLSWGREELQKMLGELTDAALILPYEIGGKAFAAIAKWRSYVQSMRSRYPQPTFGMSHCDMPYGYKDHKTRVAAALILKHLRIEIGPLGVAQGSPSPPPETEGVRGKGEGSKAKDFSRGTRFGLTTIPDEWVSDCRSIDSRVSASEQFATFVDYYKSVSGSKGVRLDWRAAWRNWIRRAANSLPRSAHSGDIAKWI
jgi:hypothetical protein